MDFISIPIAIGAVSIVYFIIVTTIARLRTQLHDAVSADNYEKVVQLIKKGKDVNAISPEHKTYGGWTPLHQAKSAAVAKLLIEAGADVNLLSEHGWTPLYYKCKTCTGLTYEFDIIDVLLENGAKRDSFKEIEDPLVIESTLIRSNRAYLMEKLIENESEGLGRTALHVAAVLGDAQKMRRTLNSGEDINARDMEGITPLLMALLENKLDVAKILLDQDIDVNIADKYGTMPLSAAAGVGNKLLVKKMISLGSKINCQEEDGWSPLHYACHLGHSEIVKILLENGADPTLKDEKGLTPVDYAENQGYAEITVLLDAFMVY